LAVYRCGGLAVFFGGVTWQNLKAVGSFASHWSGFGKRSSSRGGVEFGVMGGKTYYM